MKRNFLQLIKLGIVIVFAAVAILISYCDSGDDGPKDPDYPPDTTAVAPAPAPGDSIIVQD